MFKQAKSAILWYYIFKFRRKIALIVVLILVMFSADYIYQDLMEYLAVTKQTELLKYALITKWLVIFLSGGSIVLNILSLSKFFSKSKTANNQSSSDVLSKANLTAQEQRLYSKPKLRNQADLLIERKAQEKARQSK